MGVIKRGILGGFSGSVGNIVGSSWKGIATMKAKPLSVANPQTAGQTAQREKFAGIVAVASLLLVSIVKPLWDRFAQGESGYNAFVRTNIDAFVGDVLTNFANFNLSRGKLLNIVPSGIVADRSLNTVVVSFPNNAGSGNALASDLISAVVYAESASSYRVNAGTVLRSAGSISVALDTDASTGETVHVYWTAARADGTLVANSGYQSAVIVA
jgi:hypothetical protein